jgi:hypothetical protein
MRTTNSRPPFIRCRDGVTHLMRAGTSFGEVEDVIELADVTEDQKAALWLLAFTMRDRREQELDARAHLAAVADA